MVDVTLVLGDCLQKMKDIPSGSIDMLLTDPPYVLSTSCGGGMMGKDGRIFMEEMERSLKLGIDIEECLDNTKRLFKSKEHFNAVFFCSNKQLIDYLVFADKNRFQYGVGVWHKSNPAPLCNFKYLNDVEYWIYIKGAKAKIGGTYASKSMVHSSQRNTTESKLYGHPTVKPQDLLEKFIINHTVEGMTILDPFMGSGSTGVGCINTNRNFIGIEMDEGYFEVAKNRINKAKELKDA